MNPNIEMAENSQEKNPCKSFAKNSKCKSANMILVLSKKLVHLHKIGSIYLSISDPDSIPGWKTILGLQQSYISQVL